MSRNKEKALKSRSFKTKKDLPIVEGKVQMTREGYVFIQVEGEEDDIFVPSTKTRGALNGDIVQVRVLTKKSSTRRKEGEVIEIVDRSKKAFIGILHTVGNQAWVLMQSRTMPYDIRVDFTKDLINKKGTKVAVVVDRWDRKEPNPHGYIIDFLGKAGENDTEMHAILTEYGLPYKFEKEVEDAADSIPAKITPKDLKGRKDFRNTLTFTIDPADAKDFDDALSFKKLDNGNYEVGVHIADVSYYVTPGSIIDKEAQTRGTSVYLVDRTVPMLPEKLCNKLCSLRPNEDKLTFSAVFEITSEGKILSQWFDRTVICSKQRFAYEDAQSIIELGWEGINTGFKCPIDIKEAVLTLWKLAKILRNKRFSNGAISFERPEMKVIVDNKGRPIDVYQKISKEANWLIEEFMLLANRSVAEFIATCGKMDGRVRKGAKTFIYRVHDKPNEEKIKGVKEFAGFFGYKTKLGEGNENKIAKELNALLKSCKNKPEFYAIELLALRSMAKASYSTDNIGHYGLAFKFYTHFTSPIRRYPDTMVHRLLALYLDNHSSTDKNYYSAQCNYASEREVIAANAERDSIKYKLVEYMQDKLDKEFDGCISGLTEWGMYVEVEPTKIEGMVPLRDIKLDFFEFDEKHYKIVGRRTGKVYRLGDRVRVKVKTTNLEQRLLDYELIDLPINAPKTNGFRARAKKAKEEKAAKKAGSANKTTLKKHSSKQK